MAQQSASANGVTIALWSVFEEIDDDDEDVLEVTIEILNESARDLWDLSGNIRDMDGTHAVARAKPSRIEASGDDLLSFWVPSNAAAWLFKMTYNTDTGSGNLELGPFTNELRIDAKPRTEKPKISQAQIHSSVESNAGDANERSRFVKIDDERPKNTTTISVKRLQNHPRRGITLQA